MSFRTIFTSIALFSFVAFGNATRPTSDKDHNDIQDNTEQYEEYDFPESSSELEALFSVTGEEIVETAMKYIGRPYRHGAAGPTVFDCSGFTSFVYKNSNISLSRCSRTQYTQGIAVDRKDLTVGDLVFFTSPRSGRAVGHVGIVTKVEADGNFHFVHASNSGVKVDNFAAAKYYHHRYIGARRILDY